MTSAAIVQLYEDPSAARIAAKIDAWRKNETEWAVVVLGLAQELWGARQKHKADIEFGAWLRSRCTNVGTPLSRNECAALLKIGEHADLAAPLLAKTERRSVRTFVDARGSWQRVSEKPAARRNAEGKRRRPPGG